MSIQINIHIPDEDIGLGTEALAKRLAVFGYSANRVIGKMPELAMPYAGDQPAEASNKEPIEQPKEPAKRGRPKKTEDKPQISTTPENRVEPEAVVDDEETAQQDAADEAAEVEAAREPEKALTVEDVKKAVGLYVGKFGMAETQEDGPKIFVQALGNPPAGSDIWKMSLLANADQATLAKAVTAWEAAAARSERFGG
jgi:hypothetical protein